MTNAHQGPIVEMIENKAVTSKKRSRQSKGTNSLPNRTPPFVVTYSLLRGDEVTPAPTESVGCMPRALEDAAWDYVSWDIEGRKKTEPLLLSTVKQLCKHRLTLSMGLGSCIYFESKEDALALVAFFE